MEGGNSTAESKQSKPSPAKINLPHGTEPATGIVFKNSSSKLFELLTEPVQSPVVRTSMSNLETPDSSASEIAPFDKDIGLGHSSQSTIGPASQTLITPSVPSRTIPAALKLPPLNMNTMIPPATQSKKVRTNETLTKHSMSANTVTPCIIANSHVLSPFTNGKGSGPAEPGPEILPFKVNSTNLNSMVSEAAQSRGLPGSEQVNVVKPATIARKTISADLRLAPSNTNMATRPAQSTVVQRSQTIQTTVPASQTLTPNSTTFSTVTPDIMHTRKVRSPLNPMTVSTEVAQSRVVPAAVSLIAPSVSVNAVRPNATPYKTVVLNHAAQTGRMATSETLTTPSMSANASKPDIVPSRRANQKQSIAARLIQTQDSQSTVPTSQTLTTPSMSSNVMKPDVMASSAALSPFNLSSPDVLTQLAQSTVMSESQSLVTTTSVNPLPLEQSGDCPSVISHADNSPAATQVTSHYPSGKRVLELSGPHSVSTTIRPQTVNTGSLSQPANLPQTVVEICGHKMRLPLTIKTFSPSQLQCFPWYRQLTTCQKLQMNTDGVSQSCAPTVPLTAPKRQKAKKAKAAPTYVESMSPDGIMTISRGSGAMISNDHMEVPKNKSSYIPNSTVMRTDSVDPTSAVAYNIMSVSSSSTYIPKSTAVVATTHEYTLLPHKVTDPAPLTANNVVTVSKNVETIAPYRVVRLPPQGRSPTIPIFSAASPKQEGFLMPNTGLTMPRNTGMPVQMPISSVTVPETIRHNSGMLMQRNHGSEMANPLPMISPEPMREGSETRSIQIVDKEVDNYCNRDTVPESSLSVFPPSGLSTMNPQVGEAKLSQTKKSTLTKRKPLSIPCTSLTIPGTGPTGMEGRNAGPSTQPIQAPVTQVYNSTTPAKEIFCLNEERPCEVEGKPVMTEDVLTPNISEAKTTSGEALIQESKETCPGEMPDAPIYKASLLSGCSMKISRLDGGKPSVKKTSNRKESIKRGRIHKQRSCHCKARRCHKIQDRRSTEKSNNLRSKHEPVEYGDIQSTNKSAIQDSMLMGDEYCIQQLISSGRIDNQGRVRNIDHSALQSCASVRSVKNDVALSEGKLDQPSCIRNMIANDAVASSVDLQQFVSSVNIDKEGMVRSIDHSAFQSTEYVDSVRTDVTVSDLGKEERSDQPSYIGKIIVSEAIASSTDVQHLMPYGMLDEKGRVRNIDCKATQGSESQDSARIDVSLTDVENKVQYSCIKKVNVSEQIDHSTLQISEPVDSVETDDKLCDLENRVMPVQPSYIGKLIAHEVIVPSADEDVQKDVESVAGDQDDAFNDLVYQDVAESDDGDPLPHFLGYPAVRKIFDLDKEGATTVINPKRVTYGKQAGYCVNKRVSLARSAIHITSTEPEPPSAIDEEISLLNDANLWTLLQKEPRKQDHTIDSKALEELRSMSEVLSKAEVIPSEVKSFLSSLMNSIDSLQETSMNLEEAQKLSLQTKLLCIHDTNRAGWTNVQKVISRHQHLLGQVCQTSSSMLQHLLDQVHHVWLKDVPKNVDQVVITHIEGTAALELGIDESQADKQRNNEKQNKGSPEGLRAEYSKLKRELHLAACVSPDRNAKKDEEHVAADKSKSNENHRKKIPSTSGCYVNLSDINIKSNVREDHSEKAKKATNTLSTSERNFTSIKPMSGVKNKSEGSKHLNLVKKSSTSKSSSTFLDRYSHKHSKNTEIPKKGSKEVLQISTKLKDCYIPAKGNELEQNSDKYSSDNEQRSSSASASDIYTGTGGGNHKKGHNPEGSRYYKANAVQKEKSTSSKDARPSQVKRRLSDPDKEAPASKSSRTLSGRKEEHSSCKDVSLRNQEGQPGQQSSSAKTNNITASCTDKDYNNEPLNRQQILPKEEIQNKDGEQSNLKVSEVQLLKKMSNHATETASSTTVAYDLSDEELDDMDSEHGLTVIQTDISETLNNQSESTDTGLYDDRKRIIKELERLGRIQQSLSKRSSEIIMMYENIENNCGKLKCEPSVGSSNTQNCSTQKGSQQSNDIPKDEKPHGKKKSQKKQYNRRDYKKNKGDSNGHHSNTVQNKEIKRERAVSERRHSKDKVGKASGTNESQFQKVSEAKDSGDAAISHSATKREEKRKEHGSKHEKEKRSHHKKKPDHVRSGQSNNGLQQESADMAISYLGTKREDKLKEHGIRYGKTSHHRKKSDHGKSGVSTSGPHHESGKTLHHEEKLKHVRSGTSDSGLQQESGKKTTHHKVKLDHGKAGASNTRLHQESANKHTRNIKMTETKTVPAKDQASHSKGSYNKVHSEMKQINNSCNMERSGNSRHMSESGDQTRKLKKLNPCYRFVNNGQEWKQKTSVDGKLDTVGTKSGNPPDKAGRSKETNKVQSTQKPLEIKISGKGSSPEEVITSARKRGLWQRQECISIVNAVYNLQPYSEAFRSQVDSTKIPDYYQIVKLPISLDCVASRIRNCHYEDVYHFVSDMRRIFWNCRLYNENGQKFIRHCAEVQNYFEKKLRKTFPNMDFKGVSGKPQLPSQPTSTQQTPTPSKQTPTAKIPLELQHLFN